MSPAFHNQVSTLSRWLQVPLGLVFVLFGTSKFYSFMPTPPVPPEASAFLAALLLTGYIWPLVGVLEVGGGVLLLINRFTGLAILLLGPVVVHIILYLTQLVRTPQAYGMALFQILAFGSICWRHRMPITKLINARETSKLERPSI